MATSAQGNSFSEDGKYREHWSFFESDACIVSRLCWFHRVDSGFEMPTPILKYFVALTLEIWLAVYTSIPTEVYLSCKSAYIISAGS